MWKQSVVVVAGALAFLPTLANATPVATRFCVQAAGPGIQDKAPTGTYSVVPVDTTRTVYKGDFGKNGPITEQRQQSVGSTLDSGLDVHFAEWGITRVERIEDATGLVLVGEVLVADAGSVAARIASPVNGPGKAEIHTVWRVVDAKAPDIPLFQVYVVGEDLDSVEQYALPPLLSQEIPKSIRNALKKPTKAKTRTNFVDIVKELRAEQDAVHGPG